MAATLFHLTTGAPVDVHMEGGGMRYRPQPRMSYKKRLMLAEAQRALEDAEAAEAFDKDPRRCLAEGPDGNQCRGYRMKDELYCIGHKRSAHRKHFAYAHEEFEEALPMGTDS